MGTGACELLAPEHFVVGDSGFAEFHPEAGPMSRETLEHVTHRCPQGAIAIVYPHSSSASA